MFVDFNILNQLGSPSINSNTFANRPAAGQTGRLFVSIDTFEIYRDNGTTWDLIGGPGSSTVTGTGAATQVAYWTAAQSIGGSNNLWWDNTSGFLGVGSNAPTARIEAVKTDGIGIYANYTTNAGSGSSATAIWAKNVTNSSGYGAVIEETTPNATAGQYPLLIKHSLSSGTAGVGMGTGVHWQLPDDAGTFKTTQLTVETINAAAATYATRYRFNVQSNGSSTPVAYLNATGLGIFTATPGAALDIHSTGTIAQLNSTGTTNNGYLAFQRTGATTFSIGDTYNGGSNYFRIFGSALSADIVRIFAATGESFFTSTETYSSGNSIGVSVQNNLTIPNGVNVGLAALGGVNSNLNLSLGGSTTVANTGRQGLEGSTTIGFTGAGTLTMTQGSTVRAFSALSSVYAFNGSAVGTITHLAGLRICFPDNVGSAVNITNNYALLINDQTTGTGTVTYTNRWGIYQEGSSDLNYMAANLLLGSTVNTGEKLQVTGLTKITGATTINAKLSVLSGLIGNDFSFVVQGAPTFPFGSTNGKRLSIISDSGGDANGLQFGFDATDGTGIIAGSTNALGAGIDFYTFDGFNWGNRMRVTKAGKLGIGTNTPSGLLQLNGVLATPSDAANLTIKQSGTTYTDGIYLERGAERKGYYMYISGTDDSLTFRRNNSGTLGDVMYLTRDGKVGINGSPSTQLSVIGGGLSGGTVDTSISQFSIDNNGDAGIQILTPNSNIGRLIFGTTADRDGGLVRWDYTNKNFDFSTDTTGGYIRFLTGTFNERAQITTGGNFLIGTTTDNGNKLQVNGGTYIDSTLFVKTQSSGTSVTFRTTGGTNNPGIFITTTEATGKCLAIVSGSTGSLDFGLGAGGGETFTLKGNGQARFVPRTSNPAGAEAGDVYYNSSVNKLRLYDGTNWVDLN